MHDERPLQSLSDDDLLRRLTEVLQSSRRVEADLVAHIGEVDERRLFAREASPSMFAYCTGRLHLSEAEAYLRIEAARVSRRFPRVLQMLREGRLHLSGIARLAPHLRPDTCDEVLRRAAGLSKRQILELVAELAPRPEVKPSLRKLPERQPAPTAQLCPDRVVAPAVPVNPPPPAPPSRMEPLAPGRYHVQFTATTELRDKLTRLARLLHADGDLAAVIEAAVTDKLERLEARRFGRTPHPRKDAADAPARPQSRAIPAAVRRTVFARDAGRCTYVDAQGRRCPETVDVEFHHSVPFARGGAHSPSTLRMACRSHNLLYAEHDYGRDFMARFRTPSPAVGNQA